MLRKIEENDRALFLQLMDDFYHSPAVTDPINPKNYETTFNFIVRGDHYVDGYMVEFDNETVGYLILSITYSNEVGGYVTWLEELYIDPKYQGQGYGEQTMLDINETLKDSTRAFRLEVSPENEKITNFYKRHGFEERVYLQMYHPNEKK